MAGVMSDIAKSEEESLKWMQCKSGSEEQNKDMIIEINPSRVLVSGRSGSGGCVLHDVSPLTF